MSRRRPGSRLHAALNAARWRTARKRVLERDGHRCRECGRAGRLEVDHKQPLQRGGALYAGENLQSLCRDCHIEKTRRENSRPPTKAETDWKALVVSTYTDESER